MFDRFKVLNVLLQYVSLEDTDSHLLEIETGVP